MSETTEKDLGIQNEFFNQARKARSRVTIFLGSGKRLVGRIKAFDRFTILLDAGGGGEEMIFKHAIATISASSRPPMGEGRSGERSFRSEQAARSGAPATATVSVPTGPAPATAAPTGPAPATATVAAPTGPAATTSPADVPAGPGTAPAEPSRTTTGS